MDSFFLRDWRMFMAAIRQWLAGGDPYGPFPDFFGPVHHAGAYGYPPPSLILATPLALLPWQLTGALFVLASIACFERWVRRVSGRSGLAWLLLWLPLVQGLVLGQTTLLALMALVFAEFAYDEEREGQAGVLLALALLKPQTSILAVGWLLLRSLGARRYRLPLTFVGVSAALWAIALLIAGPQIVPQWVAGLRVYGDLLPDRPLLFPPFGPLIAVLSIALWWRHGRADTFGLLILLSTLCYPLSVIYMTSAVAVVVIRWRRQPAWYVLALSWAIPLLFPLSVRTPDTIAALTQAIACTGLLAGLLPPLPALRRRAELPGQAARGPNSQEG
jgi:hypothetical protein